MRDKKIWLVGASEGIGRALAQRLTAEGARLALTARNTERLTQLASELGALAVPADVQDMASLTNAYETLRSAWGTPDIVIYNAGFYEPMAAQDLNLPLAEKMMDINFSGALRTLSFILPDFIAANKGHIALVASVAAYRGLPGAIGYGASKAALLHLAQNIAVDLQDTGIKVHVICPGFVRTRLTAKNSFTMIQMIEPEQAARQIVDGLKSSRFEIRFPFPFAALMKFFSILPHRLFLRIMRSSSSR